MVEQEKYLSREEITENARIFRENLIETLMSSPEFLKAAAQSWLSAKPSIECELGGKEKYLIKAYPNSLSVKRWRTGQQWEQIVVSVSDPRFLFLESTTKEIHRNNRFAMERVSSFCERLRQDTQGEQPG